MLNLWHGVDDAGKEYNPSLEETKVTPINKNKVVGMPQILDKETKDYYLKLIGKLLIKDKQLYNTLADALYIEFNFNRATQLSQNISLPKHVTFIEEWINANT